MSLRFQLFNQKGVVSESVIAFSTILTAFFDLWLTANILMKSAATLIHEYTLFPIDFFAELKIPFWVQIA